MPGLRPTVSALYGALLLPLLVPALISSAHADVYHAVATGETLSSVAAKYRVTADQLRAANGLKEGDSVPLGAMLLRVPGVENKGFVAPSIQAPAPAPAANGFGDSTLSSSSSASGTISKTVLETVRAGDTWDSIASRYRAAGNDVSTDALRRRNNWVDLPAAGSTVVVPLGQVTYSAPAQAYRPTYTASAQTIPTAQAARTSMMPRTLDGGVMASGEMDMPVAKDNSATQPPVFAGATVAPRRGNLPSRGGYGQLARTALGGEVRILSPNEEAAAPPPVASTPRVTTAKAPRSSTIARVARVANTGAQIRRLPQASAVTLYKCSVGTQLAVLKQEGPWSAVLMSDRSTGWLPTRYLAMTPQTVDVSAQIVEGDPGGSVNGYAHNYAGENPMVAQALRWLGTRYVYGGTTRRGIDCSSLVQHSFAACGYNLPRTAAQQAKIGVPVAPAQLRAGDRLYFSASGTRIDHTGLYMGDGLFVHASGSGRQVMVSNLFTPRNWNIFVGARR